MNYLRHIGITVTDLDVSLAFYRDMLGFQVYKEMQEQGEYIDKFSQLSGVNVKTVKMKEMHDGCIELLKYDSHPKPNDLNKKNQVINIGCSHVAFTIQDLDALCEKLKENGIFFHCSPTKTPDGYAKVAFCRDPDGTIIELVELLGE